MSGCFFFNPFFFFCQFESFFFSVNRLFKKTKRENLSPGVSRLNVCRPRFLFFISPFFSLSLFFRILGNGSCFQFSLGFFFFFSLYPPPPSPRSPLCSLAESVCLASGFRLLHFFFSFLFSAFFFFFFFFRVSLFPKFV